MSSVPENPGPFIIPQYRWMPTAPVAFPHYSDRDDVYKGYFIPKKTTIIPNVWSMHRNEDIYPDSSNFIPERYLDGVKKPIKLGGLIEGHYGFGFGRRCVPILRCSEVYRLNLS